MSIRPRNTCSGGREDRWRRRRWIRSAATTERIECAFPETIVTTGIPVMLSLTTPQLSEGAVSSRTTGESGSPGPLRSKSTGGRFNYGLTAIALSFPDAVCRSIRLSLLSESPVCQALVSVRTTGICSQQRWGHHLRSRKEIYGCGRPRYGFPQRASHFDRDRYTASTDIVAITERIICHPRLRQTFQNIRTLQPNRQCPGRRKTETTRISVFVGTEFGLYGPERGRRWESS